MFVKSLFAAATIILSAGLALPAQAEPTHVMVRARSADAKFIGTSMGGVSVTLTDVSTGKILAEGEIAGGTGDTARIMQAPAARFDQVSNAETAGFDAALDIAKPTLVRVEATGPLGRPASAITVSSEMWVIPGRDVLGDGWVLTFPGLVISADVSRNGSGASVTTNIAMMCGCPITPGGLWDSNDLSVEAFLLDGEKTVARTALAYAGTASQFAAVLPDVGAGRFTLRVVAASRKTPNAGVIEQPVVLP